MQYTQSSIIPHIHTKVPTTHQGKHSAPTWPHQSVGVTAKQILVFSTVFKIWTKSEAKCAVPKTPQAHPLQSSFRQSIMEFENLFSRPIAVDQTTLHESEEIPHSRQKISYLNEAIKHNQSNELDSSDYKHICHHRDWIYKSVRLVWVIKRYGACEAKTAVKSQLSPVWKLKGPN